MSFRKIITTDKEKLLCGMSVLLALGIGIVVVASHVSKDDDSVGKRPMPRLLDVQDAKARKASEDDLPLSDDVSDDAAPYLLSSDAANALAKVPAPPPSNDVENSVGSKASVKRKKESHQMSRWNEQGESVQVSLSQPPAEAVEVERPMIIGVDGPFPYFDNPETIISMAGPTRGDGPANQPSSEEQSSRAGNAAAQTEAAARLNRKGAETLSVTPEGVGDEAADTRLARHGIRISRESGARGMTVVAPIDLRVDQGPMPSALQLDLHFDPRIVSLDGVSVGPASEVAGKGVIYRLSSRGTARVLIAGLNNNTLSTGTIAYLQFQILDNAPLGAARISITSQVASDPKGEKLRLSARDGVIFVRREG